MGPGSPDAACPQTVISKGLQTARSNGDRDHPSMEQYKAPVATDCLWQGKQSRCPPPAAPHPHSTPVPRQALEIGRQNTLVSLRITRLEVRDLRRSVEVSDATKQSRNAFTREKAAKMVRLGLAVKKARATPRHAAPRRAAHTPAPSCEACRVRVPRPRA